MSINDSQYKVLFFGTPQFAVVALRELLLDSRFSVQLVVTQPDKPAGRGAKLQSSPVKELADEYSIPVFQPGNLKKEKIDSVKKINMHAPFDIGVVIAFGQILPDEILNLPKAGCINLHASLLPRWRGAAPIQRAIMSGDNETGVCLMQMDSGLDTGPVFSSIRVGINPEDSFASLHDILAQKGAELLVRDLVKVITKSIAPVVQAEQGITYAEKIRASEARINWSKTATEINLLIRALSPAPGAYCHFKSKRLKIFKAEVLDDIAAEPMAGKISFLDKSRIEVSCGKGVLSIKELQAEGKRRMTAGDFIQGAQLKAGLFFE